MRSKKKNDFEVLVGRIQATLDARLLKSREGAGDLYTETDLLIDLR